MSDKDESASAGGVLDGRSIIPVLIHGSPHDEVLCAGASPIIVQLWRPSITRYIQPLPGISASDVRARIAELEAEEECETVPPETADGAVGFDPVLTKISSTYLNGHYIAECYFPSSGSQSRTFRFQKKATEE